MSNPQLDDLITRAFINGDNRTLLAIALGLATDVDPDMAELLLRKHG